jgi:hypothetical protein
MLTAPGRQKGVLVGPSGCRPSGQDGACPVGQLAGCEVPPGGRPRGELGRRPSDTGDGRVFVVAAPARARQFVGLHLCG